MLLTWRCVGETAIEFPFSFCGTRCLRRLLAIEQPFHTEAAPAEAKTPIALDEVYPFHRLGRNEDPRIDAVVHAQIYALLTAAAGAATRRRRPPTHDYYYCHAVASVCTRLRQTIQDVRGREKQRRSICSHGSSDPDCTTAHLPRGPSDPGWLSSQYFALLPVLKRRPDPRYGV